LLARRIQGKNFDLWVFRLEPTNHFSSGRFGCRMTDDKDDKEVIILVGAVLPRWILVTLFPEPRGAVTPGGNELACEFKYFRTGFPCST
jgi:hypothetical protein